MEKPHAALDTFGRYPEPADPSPSATAEAHVASGSVEPCRSQPELDALCKVARALGENLGGWVTSIRGRAALIKSGAADDEGDQQDLDAILATCRKGQQLTRNLLAIARASGVEPEPLHVNALLEQVALRLERACPRLAIELELDGQLSPLLGDEELLYLSLVDLAFNAAEAMDGSGTLTLGSSEVRLSDVALANHPRCAAGDYVRLRIADTGEGMDATTLARAFEPFFTTRRGSPGLGLCAVQRAVEAHGGRVMFDSEPGHGTTALVDLPRRRLVA